MDKVDILERLRENQLWLHRDGFRTSADNARDAMQTIEAIRAENAALKEELKAINAALDDPRTDLTMTACQVIAALKEQVAQLERDVEFTTDARVKDYKQQSETIAQQAEALRVKDEALLAYPVRGEYFLEHLDATWMWDKALAIQPNPDILRERDARLVERIAASTMDYYPEVDILLGIADQIRKGEF